MCLAGAVLDFKIELLELFVPSGYGSVGVIHFRQPRNCAMIGSDFGDVARS